MTFSVIYFCNKQTNCSRVVNMLFGPSVFVCNWSNLSDSGALWPGMKPESGLIQTPSPSQHNVLTCTTGLTTSQPCPAHYSYPIQGNLAWFLYTSLSTYSCPDTTNKEASMFALGLCMLLCALQAIFFSSCMLQTLCVVCVWFVLCIELCLHPAGLCHADES